MMNKSRSVVVSLILISLVGCTHVTETMIASTTPTTPSTIIPSLMTHQPTDTFLPPPTSVVSALIGVPISKITIETEGVIYDLDWSPDGRILASTGYGEVSLWDSNSGSLIEKLIVGEGVVWDVEWNKDGKKLAITGDTNSCSVWDKDTGEFTQIPVMLTVKSASWSPNKSQLAVGLVVQRFEVLDMEEQSLVFLGKTIHGVWGIDWSPDSRMIATAEFDGYIKVWDGITGDLLKTYHSGWMGTNANSVAWSPDGHWLASSHRDGKVRIWALDNDDGTPYQIFERQKGWARALVWSPDGRMIVSTHGLGPRDGYFVESDHGISGGAAYLWDVERGALLAVLEKDNPTPIWSAAWSPDGKFIAFGNGVYDEMNGESQIVILELP
jgi:WD40 repeat protein